MNPVRLVVAERNYLKGVLRAFLEGKKNQNYVIGCFRNVPISIFDEIAQELSQYSNTPQFSELYNLRKKLLQNLSDRTEKTRWSPWAISKY
ncbi:MAG: hypothetical protein ACFFDQ_00610 [Candidatus Thorarchaeota archaeon]